MNRSHSVCFAGRCWGPVSWHRSQYIALSTGFCAASLWCWADPASAQSFNDIRISQAVNALFTYLEGSFGILIMVCAGLFAIISAAIGQYRAAIGLLMVGVGAFILRSVVSTFFNDVNLRP